MNTLTITIREASDEPGFFYDIYDVEPDQIDEADSLDGGFCTTTIENALEMANKQARDIILLKYHEQKKHGKLK